MSTSISLDGQPRADRRAFIDRKRRERRSLDAEEIEENLAVAVDRDGRSHAYMASLLGSKPGDEERACAQLEEIYTLLKGKCQQSMGAHIVFMLDESGSMSGGPFAELESAYANFVADQSQRLPPSSRLTVIMFDSGARTIAHMVPLSAAPALSYRGGGTSFAPPLSSARTVLASAGNEELVPILMLLTDGGCGDLDQAKAVMTTIEREFRNAELQAHFVAFGGGGESNLRQLLACTTNGHFHSAAIGSGDLVSVFKDVGNSVMVAEFG